MLILLSSNAGRRRWAKDLSAPSHWSTVEGLPPPSWQAGPLEFLSLGSWSLLLKLQLEILKGKKKISKKRLEALLSYQKRLVEEKGLPPSRLMLEQAALAPPSPPPAEKENASIFKCDLCYYFTHSKHGLSVHRGAKHKNKQKHESSHLVNLESVVTSSEDKDKNA